MAALAHINFPWPVVAPVSVPSVYEAQLQELREEEVLNTCWEYKEVGTQPHVTAIIKHCLEESCENDKHTLRGRSEPGDSLSPPAGHLK